MTPTSLNAYLAARLSDPAIRLFAETTAAVRADAQFVAREDDAASALFLAEEEPAALDPRAFEAVLGRIESAEAKDRSAADSAGDDPILAEVARLPSPVREAALAALKHNRWRFGGFGIRRLALATADQTHMELMRIEPGHGAASHHHGGDELTLILTGAYFDGFHHYGPGDVSLAQGEFTHAPKAEPGDVCYVLAVAFGEARFHGWIGALQRAIGFPWPPKMKDATA